MADEIAGQANAPQSPQNSGQTPASETTPQSTVTAPQDSGKRMVSEEDFKALQRKYTQENQRLAYERNQAAQAAAQLEQRLQYIETKDLDDEDKVRYELQRTKQQLARHEQTVAQYQAEMQVNQNLEMVSKAFDIPVEELRPVWDETQNADQVWFAARQKDLARQRKPTQEQAGPADTNRAPHVVDLGGGTVPPTKTALETARERNDALGYVRALLETRQPAG